MKPPRMAVAVSWRRSTVGARSAEPGAGGRGFQISRGQVTRGQISRGQVTPGTRGQVGLTVVGEAACLHVVMHRCSPGGRCVVDEHMSVELAEPGRSAASDAPCAEHADVLRCGRPHPAAGAARRVDEVLARFPGCLVAAVPTTDGGCVVGARDGERVGVAVVDNRFPLTAGEFVAATSFLHGLLVLDGSWAGLRWIGMSVHAEPRTRQVPYAETESTAPNASPAPRTRQAQQPPRAPQAPPAPQSPYLPPDGAGQTLLRLTAVPPADLTAGRDLSA